MFTIYVELRRRNLNLQVKVDGDFGIDSWLRITEVIAKFRIILTWSRAYFEFHYVFNM
jgi:hypothetical protein